MIYQGLSRFQKNPYKVGKYFTINGRGIQRELLGINYIITVSTYNYVIQDYQYTYWMWD